METAAVLDRHDIRLVKTQGWFTRHRHLEADGVEVVLIEPSTTGAQ